MINKELVEIYHFITLSIVFS